jgi:hypothetical protein
VWDQILGFNLFPKTVRETELAFYLGKLNRYGLPLDGRADYTKLDWSVWTATLASNPEQFNAIIDPIYRWMSETSSHVPLTDWYDTKTGKQVGFQARSVVGGVYMKALSSKELSAKWPAQRDKFTLGSRTAQFSNDKFTVIFNHCRTFNLLSKHSSRKCLPGQSGSAEETGWVHHRPVLSETADFKIDFEWRGCRVHPLQI